MSNKIMLTAAVTGAGDTLKKNEHVPVTPKEIADAAIASAKAGATVAHVHARDPKTGGISHNVEHYREIVDRIRESETDVIINITSGGGGDFIPSLSTPAAGGEGTDIWIIDPIDGTMNFIHSNPLVCTSIGLTINKKLVAGIVNCPMIDHMYTAIR